MRILTLLATLATSAVAVAQSPLTTTFANNNGGAAGGAVYFNLACTSPTGVTITDIDLNCGGAGGVAGASINVYLAPFGNGHTAPGWVLTTTGSTAVTNPVQTPTPFTLATPIEMTDGCQFRVAIVASGFAHAYTTAGTGFPQSYSTAELTLSASGASNVPFAGSIFSPRVVNTNIYYANAGTNCPQFPIKETYGAGCYAQFTSFYELFSAAASFDLSSSAITLTNNGNGYDVTAGGSYNPVGSLGTPTPVALTDDSQAAVGTLGLVVGSNGWVALGAGNSNSFSPSATTLLGNPSTAFYTWHDMNPAAAGSGQVQYEEAGTVAQITFDGVYNFGGSTAADANFFQFQIDTATGNVVIAWDVMALAGNAYLVGYSPGGPSANPGSVDLSAGLPLSTSSADLLPLALDSNLPQIGTNWDLTANNIDATSPFGVFFFGDTVINPGIDLGAIGGAGCSAYTNANIGFFSAPIAGTSSLYSVAVPASPALAGAELAAQAAGFTTLNALTFATSNGLRAVVGN